MASFADYMNGYGTDDYKKKKKPKLVSPTNEIAPVKKISTTTKTTVTPNKTSSYFDDGYDFGDISKTILGTAKATGKTVYSVLSSPIKEQKSAEEKKQSIFDKTMTKKYSTMSLSDLEKEYARIEKEEKEHKEKNGGKVVNTLTKVGSYIGEGMTGQTGSDVRSQSQANIDKINDYTREKEILNTYRKQRATEEYLGGLSAKQLKMLDSIAEAKDLENAAQFSILAPQGGMDATTYSKITEAERTAGKEAREKLYNQLKKKNPKKSDEELNELIDNMVELRKNQVNAQEKATTEAQLKETATEQPVASFLLSRGANLLGGITDLAELYMQRGNEYGLDINAPGFALTNASSAIDEQIQLDHDWKIGEVDAFDLFYEVGTGMVDNVARLAMSGGNSTMAGAIMFSQVATQGIIEGKKKGYSDSKALTMGLLQGTFEAISEKVSLDYVLGSGGGALKKLAKSFVAEGSEELTSSWLNRVADQIANGNHSELSKQYEAYKNEGLTDAQALTNVVLNMLGEDTRSFVVAGLSGLGVGGVATVSDAVSNAQQKNALNENEQKVFDKVVEARIAEATEDGKTLSKQEEAKIRNEVLRSIDNGSLDTEEIESILAPEDYEKYKKVADTSAAYESKLNEGIEKMQARYDELQTEYDKLNELDLMKAKLGDHNRQNKIKEEMDSLEEKLQQWETELEEYKNDTKRSELESNLKTKLGENVYELVKDSRLAESYRVKQKFEADFEKFKGTKHEDAARKSLENAVKAGVDNSKGMRTLMESNARFSANTGVVFEYTTNEQEIEAFTEEQTKAIEEIEAIPEAQRTEEDKELLKEMKDTLSKVRSGDMVVDGKKKPGVITVNLDSPKALNVITGHEIGHLLEKAKHYKKTQDALFEYARMKGVDIEAELAKKAKSYKGVKDSDPRAELFSDLVGGYLYTDYDFVVHLANNNRTAFHSLWDSVKYLYKLATAGSKEARQLEKVKRNFEKAYKEAAKSGAKVEGTKNSLTDAQYSLSAEQEAYFKDSKVRDENGNLKVMYHGTSNGGFTSFDTYGSNYGLMGTGSYFTDNKSVAESYTNKGKGNNKQVYESYLNITNPLDMDAQGNAEEWAKAFPDVDFPESGTNEQFYRAVEEFYSDQMMPKWEAAEEIRESIQFGMGYDGITHIGGGRFNKNDDTRHQVYIAFEPEQIKNIDNVAPTKDADIRYSLTETDNKYLDAVNRGDTETAQRMVDEVAKKNGYTKAGYHGTLSGGFTVFEKRFAKVGSNSGAGFYFSNNLLDSTDNYSDVEGADNYFKASDLADHIIDEGEWNGEPVTDYDEALKIAKEELTKNPTVYNVYLKMDNPYVRDYKNSTNLYDVLVEDFDNDGYSREDYDSDDEYEEDMYIRKNDHIYERLYDAVSTAWDNIANRFDYADGVDSDSVSQIVSALTETAYDYEKIGWDEIHDAIIQNSSIEVANDDWFNTAYAETEFTREILEELGYDSIIDKEVSQKFNQLKNMDAQDTEHYIIFNSNKIKDSSSVTYDDNGNVIPLSERFDESNPDIRYSLTEDTEGRELTPVVQKRFANSKAVDENGRLKVLYHGTASGEFTIFDKSKGSVEGDFGSGFYFTDNETDVENNYEGGGADFENKVWRRAEQIWDEDMDIQMDEAHQKARAELYKGSHKFEVYLNIENPAIVGETNLFDPDSYYEEYDREDYESDEDYEGDVEQLISDDIDKIIWDIGRNVDVYSTDGIAEVLWDAVNEGGIDTEQLKANINNLYLEDNNGNLVGNEVARQIIESLGYDGIIDPTVSHKWSGMQMEEGTTHYIVFKPNQIKSVANENPTDNPDIRYSLSTEYTPQAKSRKTMKPTNSNLQKDMWSVRDIRNKTMLENNYTQADIDQVNNFMDNLATFMEKAGVTYKFIGLKDVNNAKVKVVYDTDGTPKRITMSAMVKNGEYPVNFDFTTICKKRQSMSMVIEELARRKNGDGTRELDEIDLDAKALWTINEELRKAGLETACLGCFVESKRYNIQNFANKATTMWNSIVDEIRREQGNTQPVEKFNFAEGIDLEKVNYSKVDKIFRAYRDVKGRTSPEKRMRALIENGGEVYQKYLQPSDLMTPEGIEGLKSLSTNKNDFYGIIKGVYGQAAPKEVMSFTPYNSEIALLPDKKGKNMKMAEYIAKIGGVRMQSFSDFIVSNVYDYMQMVADLSAKHLPAHAYTKEIAFAKIFGKTGIKINMSVMFDIDPSLSSEYAGLQFIPDVNGTEEYEGVKGRFEYLVADQKRRDKVLAETGEKPYVQSIGFDEAVKLQNTKGYSGNIGIIGVGYSYNHIVKMLGDNDIRYVIPYHSSSLPSEIKAATNISKATDYTEYQNTKTASGESLVGLGGFDIYKDVAKTKNPKQTAQNYLNYCKSKNYTPVFSQFDWHENYYKLLFDFDPYDTITGEYSPQTEVKNIYEGYNPAEGLTSTEAIEKLIEDEMKIQNEANRQRNAKISDVVDSVLEQLGIENNKVGFSLSEEGDTNFAPADSWLVYGNRVTDDIAPTVAEKSSVVGTANEDDYAPTKAYEAISPKPQKQPKMVRADKVSAEQPTAKILTEEPKVNKKKNTAWSKFKTNFVDKAHPFETLSLKTGNREVDAKFNSIRYADSKAQTLIGKGAEGVKALNDIQAEVEKDGLTQALYEYLYHKHNVDRMTLEDRYDDVPNKAVFGDSVTAEASQDIVDQYEFAEPKLKEYAQEIYNYNKHLRNLLVEGGVISQETADLWEEMYPHYVPIRRAGDEGLNINVALDTNRTGVNAPIKRATGGNRDILPLFDTMAQRTLQTFKAVSKNRFGVELKNTLGTTIESTKTNLDEVIDSINAQDGLLQEGKNGRNPTFTVFENGERVTFEITDEMYDALKPTSEGMAYTNKVLNKGTNIFRGLVTEFNPTFMLTNPIKDSQDVLINSQHPARTYKNFPKAVKELVSKKGKWYTEYMENGGADNTYFDKQTNTFNENKSKLSKMIGFPLEKISEANNFIERIPRLAEYIASRESGRSVDVSMLDAARVTTNFAAGGDVTKFLNRNGATFLNASVQGAAQQVRNVREAKANGLKGWVQLATKVALAGLPSILLNGLLWDDDEEYEELSDYVKQNYYVVAKTQDGKFVRIPKGRALAVIQNAFEQVQNALTGDDEVDLQSFLELAVSNLAPNNPLDNNIIAPIMQVANNETWYGEDLVPTRLQDLPAKEQYDESTDAISKWLGEKINVSPYKINYLLNQYSGGLGDVVLPMLTPEAESGDSSYFTAPLRDKFTTDSVLNNKNPSDFYTTKDELTVNANSSNATDEDILKSKYINSVGSEVSELYKEKREIQNSNLSDDLKFKQMRDIQKQINEMTKNALNTYENVKVNGRYATIGDKHYMLNDKGEWQKITDEQLEKQNEAISILGITPSQYWSNKKEYDMAAFYPEKYAVLQREGISVEDYKENYEESAFIYTDDYSWAANNPEKYTLSKAITDDFAEYRQYTSELSEIRADKDSSGKTISGSAKEKKKAYIWSLPIDEGQKAILYRSLYDSKEDKRTYNNFIAEYLNGRDDISYDEKLDILTELGFTVDRDTGNWSWN